MCDPMSITGATLALAGTAASAKASSDRAGARSDAMEAEAIRQKRYSDQAGAVWQDSLDQYDEPKQTQQLQDVEADRTAKIQESVGLSDGSEYNPGGSAPAVVKTEIAKKMGEAMKQGRQDAAGRARMGAFNSSMFNNDMNMADNRRGIGMYGTFARGSSNVLPAELQAANEEGAGWATFGDILSGAGTAAGMAGAAGYNPFGGGASAAPSFVGGSGPAQPWGSLQKATKGYRGGIGF